MRSPAAAEYLDRAALLTGELYVTTVLTTNGNIPRIAGNASYASYQTAQAGQPLTTIVRLASKPEKVAELPTATVAFDRTGKRVAWLRFVATGDPGASEIVVRDLATGQDSVWLGTGMTKSGLAWSADDRSVIFLGTQPAVTDRSDVYAVRSGQAPEVLTPEPGRKSNFQIDAAGRTLVYTETAAAAGGRGVAPAGAGAAGARAGGAGAGGGAAGAAGGGAARGGGGGGGGRGGGAPSTFVVVSLADKSSKRVTGSALALSADGSTLAWLVRNGDQTTLNMAPAATAEPAVVRTGTYRIEAPSLSPDGKLVAYQLMTNTDWEIYISDAAGTHRRLTRDIQHDLLPRFLTGDKVLGLMGEPRHRRSYLYDLNTGSRTRLFANNTIRTISPEYTWVPSADGTHLMIEAERDGDTVSPERDVSVVDLTRKITVADLLARLDRQAADEGDLRQRMTKAFQPVADLTRRVLAKGAVNHVYEYEKTLYDFDSKYITQPGNLKAIDYIEKTYRSFGYQPDVQWFTPSALQQSGGKTANVVAMLKGTENPNLIYVASSHFDSGAATPGADDDTSGTAALLEAARMLADTPLPATVVFASFTGEEAGLLGSREFVRVAALNKWNIAGALNNDMIAWAAEGSRLDNTIRYSNPGIRDVQHGAAFLFTNLITYDAKYYKGTDAAAFFDGWGDVVGGLGSYPVLANPNYHQPTDLIETISFQQILETAKVTAATLVHLASSPSRLRDLTTTRSASGVDVAWTPSPEAGVKSYVVAYGPATDPFRTRVTVTTAKATLPAVPAGTQIAVKAINARGMEGWDWARRTIK
jgi:Tol biopolymer transport system component